MMAPTIRRLQQQDAGLYHSLRIEMLREAPLSFITSLEEVIELPVASVLPALGFTPESAGNLMLGAFLDGRLIGSAGISIPKRRQEQHRATVVSTYVSRCYGRRGIGAALMEALITTALQRPDLEQLHLTVTADNEPAVALYRRLGFIAYGLEPGAIKIGDARYDKLHMYLPIQSASITMVP